MYDPPDLTSYVYNKAFAGEDGIFLPLSSASTALERSRVVKSGQAIGMGFTVNNTNAAAQFILVFDAGQVPANGAVPACSFIVNASSNLGVSWMPFGRAFRSGIVICNSSTSATLTAGAADCWFDCQYL